MLTNADMQQIARLGMEAAQVHRQIDHFIQGFPFIRLDRPATAGDGIIRFGKEDAARYIDYFNLQARGMTLVKFVPASGAASRMFKHLFEFREKYVPDATGQSILAENQSFNSISYLFKHLHEIAFFTDLEAAAISQGTTIEDLVVKLNYGKLLDLILTEPGLNYANLPKGLIKFHKYPEGARTAAEEHLVEAAAYTTGLNGKARIHFTISPEHKEKFMELFQLAVKQYEQKYGVTFDISYSVQKPSTDTLAVDEENRPFRNPDGTLLFRPGGHGALLDNLNEIDADLIFIKNIDNIVPDHLKPDTINYKKLLGGYLLWLKESINGYLKKLDQHPCTLPELDEISCFAKDKLLLDLPEDYHAMNSEKKNEVLRALLNRPIRVCGMVKNEGEPGGGPFWVRGGQGEVTLQIVESSQINFSDPAQKAIADGATHFNPVDLVCCTRSYTGETFDLKPFIDEETGFISRKSAGGNTLKAQELPGLWNGSMAKWITLFAEVPIITFNPVKTVNDLLRPEHLSQ